MNTKIEELTKVIILLEVKFADGVAEDFNLNDKEVKAGIVSFLHGVTAFAIDRIAFKDMALKTEIIDSLKATGQTMGNHEEMTAMLDEMYRRNPELGRDYESIVGSSGVIMATHMLGLEGDERKHFFDAYTGFHQMVIDELSCDLGTDALGNCSMIKVR